MSCLKARPTKKDDLPELEAGFMGRGFSPDRTELPKKELLACLPQAGPRGKPEEEQELNGD